MPVYFKKTKSEILSEAIEKVVTNTPVSAVGPGSVARSIVEAVTTELGDLYDILDFNIEQTYVSTASGEALNALGALYGIKRKEVSDFAIVDKSLGSFYFYIDSPISSDIVIPAGTNVYTSATSFVGRQHSFSSTSETIIVAGRTKAYASLTPNFVDTIYTAGRNTLVVNDSNQINSTTIRCTNPKPISPLPGYETDDDYRLRIIKQIRVTASGTVEAIRFAALGTPNVRDVKIKQAAYGMGSFEVIIVPERNGTSAQTIDLAKKSVQQVKPLGVRMFVKSPIVRPVDLVVDVFIPGASSNEISNSIRNRIEVGLRRYLQGFLPGDKLIYNQMVSVALGSSDMVKDVNVSSITINGSVQLKKNFQSQDDEQLTSGNIVVNIVSS